MKNLVGYRARFFADAQNDNWGDTHMQLYIGGTGIYEVALLFSLLFRSIALRAMAPMIIGPVQKRLKPNVKKAMKIDIMNKGK